MQPQPLTSATLANMAISIAQNSTPDERQAIAENYADSSDVAMRALDAEISAYRSQLEMEIRKRAVDAYADCPYPEGSDAYYDWCARRSNGRKRIRK